MDPARRPQRTRSYQNHLIDGARWDDYVPREDDVVVATPYKSGTTWTLAIVRELFALEDPDLPPFQEMWVDCRFRASREDFAEALEAQTHRRYLKTHLALDGLPFFDAVRYIVVGRDPRDVFMSFWNHYRAMPIDALNRIPGRIGDPLPAPPDDVHEAWSDWIGRGWFPWESEGYPFWGNLHHVRTWWEHRHRDNILFVHFSDLKRDLDGEIRRIGAHVGIEVPDAALPTIRAAVSVDAMRADMERVTGERWASNFFRHKGKAGRWRDVLTDAELEQYDRKADAILPPACHAWLEGRDPAD